MSEKLTFAAPPLAPTGVELRGFEMYLNHPNTADGIRLHLVTDTGSLRQEWIGGDEGRTLIGIVNKKDFSVQSLRETVLRWLANNRPGYAGTVTTEVTL